MDSDKVAAKRSAKADAIKAAARQCLAERGAAALSLREVARNMGEASSALYRYFPSRDGLLTALIIDAYNDLGEVAEASASKSQGSPPGERIGELAAAIRTWAKTHTHEYALIFGSPIPNYQAPASTIAAASRIPMAMASILEGTTVRDQPFGEASFPETALDRANLAELLPNFSPDIQARCLLMWSSIFGLISFELFGHFVGSVANNEVFFHGALVDLTHQLGLSSSSE